ncbi:MAG TPA: hypothetical protein PKA95_14930 [Thermomicrobiales bacterium]|nr:hypothetical protein [Thermomicrobiales bacterium]
MARIALPPPARTPDPLFVMLPEEVFFHCARAFRRAKLWEADTWPDRENLPTLGQIIADQTRLDGLTGEDIDRPLAQSNVWLY